MLKVNLNAVFYSKGNIDKAYSIKSMLWKTNYQVVNISDFSELVYAICHQQVNLLLVDGETIKLTEEFLEVVNGSKIGVPDNIFFIGYNNVECLNINNVNRFNVSYSDLNEKFFNNTDKLYFNIEKNKATKYDSNFINTYLTQYLIKLGFFPKHMGFYYIKQCIEEALLNNGVLGSLSSEIYPSVARKFGTNAINIERNIRNSIECANKYNDGKEKPLTDIYHNQKRVSNRAFLAYLLDQVIICYEQMKENCTTTYN